MRKRLIKFRDWFEAHSAPAFLATFTVLIILIAGTQLLPWKLGNDAATILGSAIGGASGVLGAIWVWSASERRRVRIILRGIYFAISQAFYSAQTVKQRLSNVDSKVIALKGIDPELIDEIRSAALRLHDLNSGLDAAPIEVRWDIESARRDLSEAIRRLELPRERLFELAGLASTNFDVGVARLSSVVDQVESIGKALAQELSDDDFQLASSPPRERQQVEG